MTKSEFDKLKFSERHFLTRGEPCKASWQVRGVGGANVVSCRTCGTQVQSDCVPKCLMNITNKES